MQNGHVESFIGRLRDECLNANWFRNLMDAREKIPDCYGAVRHCTHLARLWVTGRRTSLPKC